MGSAFSARSASLSCLRCSCRRRRAAAPSSLFRQFEYEEEVYLSLDRSATIYVNGSLAALNALRGTSFDTDPAARLDLAAVRAYYTTPLTRVARVSQWRRSNRRFVQVRIEVDDVTTLGDAAPFAWSKYDFRRDGDLFAYRQTVGTAAAKNVGNVGWDGRELTAFRLHLPSKIRYHNTRREVRGNILEWEQPLAGTGWPACRWCSMHAWIRSRFFNARSGSSASRSSRSRPPSPP